MSALDKAAQRGIIHKNQAARRKSRIAKAANKAIATGETQEPVEAAAVKKAAPKAKAAAPKAAAPKATAKPKAAPKKAKAPSDK